METSNIAHQPIDLFNPVDNKNNSGFLPEERNWFDEFLSMGFTDSYRYLHPTKQEFTWWTFRNNARSRNVGWRLDYQFIKFTFCPIYLEVSY